MSLHQSYIDKMEEGYNKEKFSELLFWIKTNFSNLEPVIKWNEPMFVLNGTFIIGFSTSKKHFSISPEVKGIQHFEQKIEAAGYDHTKNIIRVRWAEEIDYDLLKEIIEYNILDKEGHETFWR